MKCPICGKEFDGAPAISRTKSHEPICPKCGGLQALYSYAVYNQPKYRTKCVYEWCECNHSALSFVLKSLDRHIHLDWGDMDDEDMRTNDVSVVSGDRVFSAYKIPQKIMDECSPSTVDCYDNKIWIITEADRSATTILFPSEY